MNTDHISDAYEIAGHFPGFFENDLVGFHIFGPDQKFIDINERELAMIGYRRDEIIGRKSWADLIIPDQQSRYLAHWQHLVNGHRVHNLEYTLQHKDGHRVYVILNALGVYEPDGRLAGTRGCVVDVSQRRNIERALRRSEEKFRSMVETAQEGIWVVDSDGVIQYANKRLAAMLGYTVEEMTGLSQQVFVEKKDHDYLSHNPDRRLSGIRERYLVCKNGSQLLALESRSILLDEDGNQTGTLGMITDRSALMLEERRQRLAVDMLQLLNRAVDAQQVIPQMLDMIRDFGHFDGVSLRLKDTSTTEEENNRDLEKIDIRIGNDCLCGDHICHEAQRFKQLYSVSRSTWRSGAQREAETSGTEEGIYTCCQLSGYESVALIPLRSADAVIGFLQICDKRQGLFSKNNTAFLEGIASSIGIALDRLHNQQTLREHAAAVAEANAQLVEKNHSLDTANEKLRQANSAKSDFVSIASHELRSPLSSIVGFTQTLLADDLELDDQSRKHFLKIIEKEGKRLNKLIADMLDLSKIEIGVVSMRIEAFDLHTLIVETVDFLRIGVPDSIGIFTDCDSPQMVRADRDRLKQVLINLITNAQRFNGPDRMVEVHLKPLDSYMQVSVKDHGPGISPEQKTRIFDRFYRGKNPANSSGSGLGLAIAQEIIHTLGGQIWVDSVPGEGACFSFTVPGSDTKDSR